MKAKFYRAYLIIALMVILAFNNADRFALGLLFQGIKSDLMLSDTQLGFLTGIAFALFYAVMGIPIARWADYGNRVRIISITCLFWSIAVALCGFAGNFLQLLLIRVGVGVGESGCIPPAHSLIAHYYARAARPRAIATYMLGVPLGMVIGYFLGGRLNELYGWRVTFMLLGLPGVLLGPLAWLTLKEPRDTGRTWGARDWRHLWTPSRQSKDKAPSLMPSLKEVCTTLWANKTFRHLLFAYSVSSFFGVGILQWKPAFFIRSFGIQTGELGTWFAAIYGVCGFLGIYLGGALASRFCVRNERLQIKAMAVAYCSYMVISAGIYLTHNRYLAFGLLALGTLGSYTINGPLFATIQTLVPERMRAMSVAIFYLFANIIGMGLGPLAAGALSDAFRPLFGEESLRYALLALTPGYVWTARHLWLASGSVMEDIQSVQTKHAEIGREEYAAAIPQSTPSV